MGRPPSPLTPAEAREAVHRLLQLDAMSFTRHAGERSDERNFDRRDVEHVLKTGRFGQPSWDERYRNWKYPVSGTDLDGENLTVIAAIEPAWARLTIITGF